MPQFQTLTYITLLQALSAYQAGILLVECFPYIPDVIMLLQELAISEDALSSKDLLNKGALRYAQQQGDAALKVSSSKSALLYHKAT